MFTAVSAYSAARPAVQPGLPAPVTQAAGDFASVMARVDQAATASMQGTGDTQQLVQAIAEAELALETAVSIRDKVVEAYQDILRMPV